MKNTHKLLNFLIFILVAGYAVFLFFYKNQNASKKNTTQIADFSSTDVDKVVNKYLKQTTDQMVKEQMATSQALKKAAAESIKSTKPLITTQIPLEQQIHKASETEATPRQEMSFKVNQEIQNKKLEEVDRQEYARQFIENARKGGYHIELNEDLEVKSVTPIRKPSQEIDTGEIFQSN